MNEQERKAELEGMMGELRDGRARVRELTRIEKEERALTKEEQGERSMLNTRNNNLVVAIGELQSRIL